MRGGAPARTHKAAPPDSPFNAPYPATPKTFYGEVPCASATSGQQYKATVWTTAKGIDLDGRVFDPKAAREYAKFIERAAEECDRMRAAVELEKKQ